MVAFRCDCWLVSSRREDERGAKHGRITTSRSQHSDPNSTLSSQFPPSSSTLSCMLGAFEDAEEVVEASTAVGLLNEEARGEALIRQISPTLIGLCGYLDRALDLQLTL